MMLQIFMAVGMLLVQSVAVSAPPSAPWYASIQRLKDCTDYEAITLKPDGSLAFGDKLSSQDIPFPYTREDAFSILLNTCEFTRAHGPDRVPSLQVELVNVLWHQPNRLAVFEDLYERGNFPGKLHALVGLYAIDRSHYSRRLADLPQDGSVVAQNGCAVFSVPVRGIVRDITNGTLAAEYQNVGKYMTWLPKVNE